MRSLLVVLLFGTGVFADPCVSGPQEGQRPGPYSFLVASGPQRGQQTCYVCETADKPAVIVFARTLNEPLKKLLSICDEAIAQRPKDSLNGWMTLLGEKSATLDDLAKFAKNSGLKSLPVGVFDDPTGPPSYRLHQEADVTVLLFIDKKVTRNFAFRAGELQDADIKKVQEELSKLGKK